MRLCRVCNGTKLCIQQNRTKESFILRTIETYDKQTARAAQLPHLAPIYGIKRPSILNQIKNDHVICGLSPDLGHDLLEGLGQEVLENVILTLVSDRLFTLEYLSSVIMTFPFADCDKGNKPQT